MEKYKINTKVKLSPTSQFKSQIQYGEDGETILIGEIIKINNYNDPDYYPYKVKYPNGYSNDYNHKDLELVEIINPIYEIY